MVRRIDHAAWDRLFARTAASGRPLQARLREMVIAAVAEGWLAPDMPLPSSREMARRLGVARNTVLLAYQRLIDEEVLEARERSGYFVRDVALAPGLGGGPTPSAANVVADWGDRLAVRPTKQRNIAKPQDWLKSPYPFLYGQFDPALFPINDWRACARQALSVLEVRGWGGDLIDGDDPDLVEQIRTRVLPRRGIWAGSDEIMVTLGAQQALYVLAELLIRPDTVVGIEEPGYPDARNIFALKTRHLRPLAIDAGGVVPDTIPEDCRLLFVTPSRQCPTGARMAPKRRQHLLDLAASRDLVLIEDDYESNFGLTPEPSPALYGLDRCGRVLYVGSLSKTLAPGLRLGYIVGPREVVREARALRRLMLRHVPTNNQRALALFLALGHFDRLLRKKIEVVQERAAVMHGALAHHLPDFEPDYGVGGSSLWIKAPEGFDAWTLAERARADGVLIEPGDVFFMAETPPRRYFRLGFSSIPTNRVEKGIAALARVARAMA